MIQGSTNSRRTLTAALAAVAALVLLAFATATAEAGVVGSNGQIQSCYAKKGKAKGTLRVVPTGARCRKGEKPLTWNSQGQTGSQGNTGATGGTGTSSQVTQLQDRITQLTDQVTQLQGILAGLTNSGLLSAVNAVPKVTALCGETSTLVTQTNSLVSVLNNLSLGGIIPVGLVLNVTGVPSALSAFACP